METFPWGSVLPAGEGILHLLPAASSLKGGRKKSVKVTDSTPTSWVLLHTTELFQIPKQELRIPPSAIQQNMSISECEN